MSDEANIVDKTASIFLAGSYLVKAAIGENIDNETLGGATTHCEISGVTDYKAKDDKDALDKIKNIVDKIGDYNKAGFNRIKAVKPSLDEKNIGQWNKLVIISKNGVIIQKLNRKLVNQGTESSVTQGRILLQYEGYPIDFRKINIKKWK